MVNELPVMSRAGASRIMLMVQSTGASGTGLCMLTLPSHPMMANIASGSILIAKWLFVMTVRL